MEGILKNFLQDFPDIINAGYLASLEKNNEYLEHLYKAKNIAEVSSLTQENWIWAFALYSASSVAEEGENISKETKDHLKVLFQNTENQNFVLHSLKKLYEKILQNEEIPNEEKILLDVLSVTGAGTLTLSESVAHFLYAISGKELLYTPLLEIKKHFESKKLNISDQDFGQWCALSIPLLQIFPSMFAEYLPVFLQMNDKEFSQYLKEVFPLHNVLCLLAENNENLSNEAEKFFQEYIDRTKETLNIEEEHEKVFSCIQQNLKKSFGLKKIAESFDEKMIRSVKNFSMYFANLTDKDEEKEKETYLGLFFALHLHNKWNDFVVGNMSYEEVCEYIEDDTKYIEDYMERRNDNVSFLTEGDLEIRKTLHEKTIFQGSAHVSTLDTKLESIEEDIEDLLDSDIYSEEEKKLLSLVKKHEKNFGKVLAKLWQKKGGKDISFTEDEEKIIKEIQEAGMSRETQEEIKKIQDDLNVFFGNTIVNLQNKVKKYNIPEKLKKLKEVQTPPQYIIDIFKKCGVELSTDSGVRALSSEVEYFRKLLAHVKLTEEEKQKGGEYIQKIETQVKELESILKSIHTLLKDYKKRISFLNKKEDDLEEENEINQKARFEEFMKKLDQEGGERLVVTTMTSDMNEVIPRIRQCLSCTSNQCNNDTNLSFGDGYRFFLFSETFEKKDCSDQLVSVLKSSTEGYFLVFDTLYGERNVDIFALHIVTALQKTKKTGIPVFLPKTVLSFEEKDVRQKIKKHLETEIEWKEKVLTLVIPETSGEDFYQEFTEDTRNSGEEIVEGYVIKL
jgi:hypothetical protein